MPDYDQPTAIILKTQELLKNDKRTLLEIYRDTGIPFYWLRNFSDGRYKNNPSINRVIFLYEHLSGKKLKV